MRNILIVIPLIFLCCLGCQQGGEPATVDVEADIRAIKDIVADTEAAINTSDIEKFMSFYADGAIDIPPNGPAQVGKEVIGNGTQQFFDEVNCQEEDVVKAVHVDGDLAVAHVVYSGVYTPKAGGEPRKGNGNIIMVFERQPDGLWKRTYTIWSNETLVRPTST
jgi:uncharacterized protein (TIGR02246 family)